MPRAINRDPITAAQALEVIRDNPGITIRQVAEKLGVAYQVSAYHLRFLVHSGKVKREWRGDKEPGRSGILAAQHTITAAGLRTLDAKEA